MKVVLCFCFLNLIISSCGLIKKWKLNTILTDSNNWLKTEDYEDDEECYGIIFPTMMSGLVELPTMEVKEIVFPKDGEFLLRHNSTVTFNNESKEKINCVYLNKKIFDINYWTDVEAWEIVGVDNVEAIPDLERLPCQYDDVVLPYGLSSAIMSFNYGNYKMKSFTFGNDTWSHSDLSYYYNSEILRKVIQSYTPYEEVIDIKEGIDCNDPTGCVCGNDAVNYCWNRNYPYYPKNYSCLNEVQPAGFCDKICGAYIQFRPVRKRFKINSIKEILKNYNSLTHVSKITQDDFQYIQIVFTEKEFDGISLDDASDFYYKLTEDKSFGARKVTLVSANRKSESSAGLVFGILFVIVLCCVTGFLMYSPKSRERVFNTAVNLRERLNNLSWRRSNFPTNFLARYRKSDDAGLFSDTGSILSLETSFENPIMQQQQQHSPSTSSTSCEENNINEEKVKSISEIENPIFHKEFIDSSGEHHGELVDLTN